MVRFSQLRLAETSHRRRAIGAQARRADRRTGGRTDDRKEGRKEERRLCSTRRLAHYHCAPSAAGTKSICAPARRRVKVKTAGGAARTDDDEQVGGPGRLSGELTEDQQVAPSAKGAPHSHLPLPLRRSSCLRSCARTCRGGEKAAARYNERMNEFAATSSWRRCARALELDCGWEFSLFPSPITAALLSSSKLQPIQLRVRSRGEIRAAAKLCPCVCSWPRVDPFAAAAAANWKPHQLRRPPRAHCYRAPLL